MNEQKFRSEMRRAEAMRGMAEPMMAEYWAGYIRGLRRAHHGEKFGDPGQHELWLELANSSYERKKQRGRGYKDGLAFGEIASRKGRPPVGDATLEKITVPSDLKSALEAKAAQRDISVADARREAYLHWVRDAETAIDMELARMTGRIIE